MYIEMPRSAKLYRESDHLLTLLGETRAHGPRPPADGGEVPRTC